jgi:hypothetical protein
MEEFVKSEEIEVVRRWKAAIRLAAAIGTDKVYDVYCALEREEDKASAKSNKGRY